MKKILLPFIVAFAFHLGCTAPERGTWFWSDDHDFHGSFQIVGDNTREDETILVFEEWSINRVYGSYKNRPVDDAAAIAAWNGKLSDHRIESQLLLSENTWIYPDNRPSLTDKLQERLIDYNDGRPAREQFKAIHLDIEPQALPEWDDATHDDKRTLLYLLSDTYSDARVYLNSQGASSIPIYADLPVWFDNLPPDLGGTGSIGWDSIADRDNWFMFLALYLEGISLMAFERDSYSSIQSGIQWEIDNFGGSMHVGLQADIGPGATWADLDEMMDMAALVELFFPVTKGIDIQSYSQFAEHAAD